MLVAIDGPAGAGKSTVARAAAEALGFTYLDTGAMYRCVALARLRDPGADPAALAIGVGEAVTLAGEDVSEAIRAPEVTAEASRVAADPAVRAALVARQRELIAGGDWVAEGRDIGTVVAPDAELKVFLDATPQERARRRAAQTGRPAADVLAEQEERDARDREREHAPLTAAPDAVILDTTGLTLSEVVDRIVHLATARRAGAAER
jgi:cytidylate kinase